VAPEQACAAATHKRATNSMFVPGSFEIIIRQRGTRAANQKPAQTGKDQNHTENTRKRV